MISWPSLESAGCTAGGSQWCGRRSLEQLHYVCQKGQNSRLSTSDPKPVKAWEEVRPRGSLMVLATICCSVAPSPNSAEAFLATSLSPTRSASKALVTCRQTASYKTKTYHSTNHYCDPSTACCSRQKLTKATTGNQPEVCCLPWTANRSQLHP